MSFILMTFIFCSQVLFSFRERWPQLRVSNSLNFPKRFQNLGTKLKLHSFALHILCLKGLETSLLGRFIYICSFIIFFLTFLFDFQLQRDFWFLCFLSYYTLNLVIWGILNVKISCKILNHSINVAEQKLLSELASMKVLIMCCGEFSL